MRLSKILLLFLILLFFFTSCSDKEAPLTGLWEFSSFEEGPDEDYADCFINLQADGKYTLFIPDYFDYGTYRQDKNDKTIFRFTSYRTHKYYGDHFTLQVTGGGKDKKTTMLSLVEQTHQYPGSDPAIFDYVVGNITATPILKKARVQFPGEDPYSYQLNRWRIKPDHEESCKEVSFRLINFLRHMNVLFEGQRKAKSEKTGYPYSPSPILFGANGMASKNIREIPPYWIHTFYNEKQAIEANHMISAIFDEKMDFPRGTKRYDEMWSKLLSQMIAIATKKDFYCGKADSATAAR